MHAKWHSAQWGCSALCANYADTLGFIAACPQGTTDGNGHTGWNTGGPTHVGVPTSDDVRFVREMIADVHSRIHVPQQLTYALGFSMGGGMVYRLLCEASDIISGFGVASQSGPFGQRQDGGQHFGTGQGAQWAAHCQPAVARPLWASGGTRDRFFPIASVETGWQAMVSQKLGCVGAAMTLTPRTAAMRVTSVTCKRLEDCTGSAIAEFCTYDNMGHFYASSSAATATVSATIATPLDATPAAWALWRHVSTGAAWPPPPSAPPVSPAPPPPLPPRFTSASPPSASAPLASLTQLTLLGATMRSVYSRDYPATNAIDGNIRSLAAGQLMTAANDEWISVQVVMGSRVGNVAVYNRDDFGWATAMLNPYELWLTAAPGAPSSEGSTAYRCGSGLSAPGLGPFTTWCGGRSDLPFITIVIRARDRSGVRLLSVGEVVAYAA